VPTVGKAESTQVGTWETKAVIPSVGRT
jgi:hypothetical protein